MTDHDRYKKNVTQSTWGGGGGEGGNTSYLRDNIGLKMQKGVLSQFDQFKVLYFT